MKLFLLVLPLVLTACGDSPSNLNQVTPTSTPSFSVTEVNLEWFGAKQQGQSVGSDLASRVPAIKAYFQKYNMLSDVMVFEEIVNLDALQNDVLGGAYQCHSYVRTDPVHQHVVICQKSELTCDPVDGGYTLETVDVTGGLRPAVHCIVKRDGKAIAHVFGVHLKATPTGAALRTKQISILEAYMAKQDPTVPIVITGDFNTYATDVVDYDKVFSQVNMTEVIAPEAYTWTDATGKFGPAKFDHLWASNIFGKTPTSHVYGPCNGDSGDPTYHTMVSDHCGTKTTW